MIAPIQAIAADERIAGLRQRCLERKGSAGKDLTLVTAASLRASQDVPCWQLRCGMRTRDRLLNVHFAVDELELLVGRLAPSRCGADEGERAAALEFLEQFPRPGGQTGHCEVELGLVMERGLGGFAYDVRARMASESHPDRRDTYQSFLYALDGITRMIENAALAVEAAKGDAPDEHRRDELKLMADTCRRVARRPPGSFREAIQLLWFVIFAIQHGESVGLVGPGHLDRTLHAFYSRDTEQGRLTDDEALLLIESLYLLVNEFTPDGLAIPVMVGGRDEEGRDVTNRLSYLCLEALRRTALVYPTVGVCWHDGTPPDLVTLAVDLIGHGYSTPAFFGDETIQGGLRARGVPPEQACRYINSTCVEITLSGASNVWVASPYYNLCGLLLEEIAAQASSPAVSFEAFVEQYRARVAAAIEAGVAQQNDLRERRRRYGGKPLQSLFTRDCIERGRDIDNGGAVYNWVECSFVGLGNLADALYVLRSEVYEQGALTLAELKTVLDADFEGHASVRSRFMNAYPKYGQGDAGVDAFVGDTVAFMVDVCGRVKMRPDDSPYVPGAFVWIMHEQLGRQTGATPDGRKAGTPFADGAGPAQGRESKGPTAAILSGTSWDHSPLLGGVAFNMKFSAALFTSQQGFDKLRDLVLTFLRRGGFETQINVVDADTLRQARLRPEDHRDLVVRIGGYTDYFTRLSTEMQDELILRTEYT